MKILLLFLLNFSHIGLGVYSSSSDDDSDNDEKDRSDQSDWEPESVLKVYFKNNLFKF